MTQQPILLVEDNADDAELTIRAFREARIANPIVHVTDGVEALDFLFHRGTYAARDNAMPSMVLLDLKLPRLDGLAVLQAIREHETTRNLPVIMMTSSDDDRDRLAAYDRHVNSYIKKPINYDEFVAAARQLGLYWIVLNLPAPIAKPV
jgi:two-component system, response regulator